MSSRDERARLGALLRRLQPAFPGLSFSLSGNEITAKKSGQPDYCFDPDDEVKVKKPAPRVTLYLGQVYIVTFLTTCGANLHCDRQYIHYYDDDRVLERMERALHETWPVQQPKEKEDRP
jgi:hypothetical protein